MIDSSEVNDLQLEDVEDYSSDYPPPGFPQAEANIHTTSETNKTPNYRRAKIIELIRTNKWVAGVVFVTLVVFITIISVVAGSAKGGSSTSENSAETEPHQPPIVIDPDTLDPEIAGPLEESLVNTYQRHGLDTVDLENDDGTTPARKAFHWLATEKNLENMDHTQKMQRYALSVFYYATNAVTTPYTDNPKPWVSAHLWLTNAHVCEWKGIVCNSQQHVIAIDLERNNLSGSIPAEIGFMASTLTTIDLTSNLIYMEGNMFSALDDLVNIETFLMDDNYLEFDKGLPAAFVHMTKMEKLRLSYNLLEGELESGHKVLANMPKLTHLEVESNFLTGTIPPIISEMENLVYLYLRRNAMKFNLDFLKGGQMTSLFALWLDSNQITGTIPTEMALLTDLASVSMTNATLVGPIPSELAELTGLRRLWLYSNKLTGEIPPEFDNLEELEVFEVHDNNLHGAMPQGICTIIDESDYQYKSLTSDCVSQVECSDSCCTQCF